jgi:hypothetical protein
MHLIARKRVKREIVTREGKVCNRGYKYLYWTNKQGRSYTRYLMSARTRKNQQMLEASRSRNDQHILILSMFARNQQQHIQIMQLLAQNMKSPEPKILGKRQEDWLSLIPRAIKSLDEKKRFISLQSQVIELQDEKIAKLSDSNKRNSDPSLIETHPEGSYSAGISSILPVPNTENVSTLKPKTALDLLHETMELLAQERFPPSAPVDGLLELPRDGAGQIPLVSILDYFRGCILRHEFIQETMDKVLRGDSTA